ncbi:adaptor-related protein complex 2, sigma 1 subunit [Planoprotostelium fungivorum]|uniref:Alpha-tubulin N-acetyltransferase n=1 Tax=Planoprotostelium fungivorum TaxID=1890364 RepID=A0A2P6NXA6_9EUKA|nr:adaptor-related protein complex 2, sigma 1 subunit [Planoprotostelium fungivorum]
MVVVQGAIESLPNRGACGFWVLACRPVARRNLLTDPNKAEELGPFNYRMHCSQSNAPTTERAAQFMLVQNRQGKTRFAKWYTAYDDVEKRKLTDEIHRLVNSRETKFTNFVEFRTFKIVYRRYAGLFFIFCVDANDNALSYLEAIHLFVEILDSYFGNVCELDIVFNFYKIYTIVDEVFLAGEIMETREKELTLVGWLKDLFPFRAKIITQGGSESTSMDFGFDLRKILPEEITLWDAHLINDWNNRQKTKKSLSVLLQQIRQVVDAMGMASAKAQGLPVPITTFDKLAASDHRLYLFCSEDRTVDGMIKTGRKKLFVSNHQQVIAEIEPNCILDFYVVESKQRSGVGKKLFDNVLKPHRLAYDRPSPKFVPFLKKHFGLSTFTPQANNFVVFHEYWTRGPSITQVKSSAAPKRARTPIKQIERVAATVKGDEREERGLECRTSVDATAPPPHGKLLVLESKHGTELARGTRSPSSSSIPKPAEIDVVSPHTTPDKRTQRYRHSPVLSHVNPITGLPDPYSPTNARENDYNINPGGGRGFGRARPMF